MKQEPKLYTQMYLYIRLLAGGYLLYTAWKIRDGIAEQPLLLIALAAFVIIGIAMAGHAGWKLWKGEYEGGKADVKPAEEEAETEETEE